MAYSTIFRGICWSIHQQGLRPGTGSPCKIPFAGGILNTMRKSDIPPAPKGFLFSAVEAAIKKPGRKDLALIFSETETVMAGAFTTNNVKAAPVRACMKQIASGAGRAIIVNSGNANACTGRQGLQDARSICRTAAQRLGVSASLVYPCSTGVIGSPLPMDRILPAADTLARRIGSATLLDVARAIMTTDTFPKMVHRKVRVNGRTGSIAGICKGAGMIAPRMATMLCFMMTDVAVDGRALSALVKDSVRHSFNRITIDGDMSTNDTVLAMANGLCGNKPLTRTSAGFAEFQEAFNRLMYDLSLLVVKDGEGATKLIEVLVKGARTTADAEKAAFAVANSSLVKTAMYGNDANWGRIMCSLGYSGVRFSEEKTDIYFNRVKVVKAGLTTNRDAEATAELRSNEVRITVDLHAGKASAQVLTCDFTEDYIRINAEYRS